MTAIRLGARLRAARKAAGFKTAKEFLKKHKVPGSTYSQHESGARQPDDETIRFYGEIFRVNFNWLQSGKGNPYAKISAKKQNTMKEELLDLKTIKKSAINQKLLSKILKQVLIAHIDTKMNLDVGAIAKKVTELYDSQIEI